MPTLSENVPVEKLNLYFKGWKIKREWNENQAERKNKDYNGNKNEIENK